MSSLRLALKLSLQETAKSGASSSGTDDVSAGDGKKKKKRKQSHRQEEKKGDNSSNSISTSKMERNSLRLALKLSLQETAKSGASSSGTDNGSAGDGKKKKKKRKQSHRQEEKKGDNSSNSISTSKMERNQISSYEQSLHEQWGKMLKRLQIYQKKHNGSCNEPRKYPPDQQLSKWIVKQRYLYREGLLRKERYDQLEAIGFQWTVGGQTEWTKMFKRLQAYQQEHNGSCNVPQRYRQDKSLGKWVNWQRYNHKKGLLSKERCDQLEQIGFEWERTQDQWTKMIKRLQAYQQEHNGNCDVPRKYPQDPTLANWAKTQRHQYKKGLLRKERCDQLDSMGFRWTISGARASTQLQPNLSEDSKTKQPDASESRRRCWV